MGPGEQPRPLSGPGLALLALLGSQLVLLYLLGGEVSRVFVVKPELFSGRILANLVWPLCGAWFLSAWLARRDPGATAVPLGFHLGWALAFVVTLMQPLYASLVGSQPIGNREESLWLAWSAGAALTALVGLGQLLMGWLGTSLLANFSLPLLQVLGAALALSCLQAYSEFLLDQPLFFVVSAAVLLAFHRLRLPRPFRLSVAWLLLGLGGMCSLLSGTTFEFSALPGALLPQTRPELVLRAGELLWLHPLLLGAALPLVLWAVSRDVVLIQGATPERSRGHLLGLGALNLAGAALGCGLPLGVLPGISAARSWSGGQFYSQAAAWCLLLLASVGGFDWLVGWLPLPSLALAWGYLLLTSAGQACRSMPAARAWWAAAWAPWLLFPEPGFQRVLLGLCWGGLALCIEESRFDRAAWIALIASLVSSTGLLHGQRWDPDFNLWSLTYFVMAMVLRAGWLYHQEVHRPSAVATPPPPELEELLADSIDSPGTSAFGIPVDNRPAEGAGSGSAS